MRVPNACRRSIALIFVLAIPLIAQPAGQVAGTPVVISWKEGVPGSENIQGIKVLTAAGVRVAAAVDHATGDVDSWYGNSILRVQLKIFNESPALLTFDPMSTQVLDAGRTIKPLSFKDALKLAPPDRSLIEHLPSGPGVFTPGPAGPGQDADSPEEQRKSIERWEVQKQQWQQRERAQESMVGMGLPRSKEARTAFSSFYAARQIEPKHALFGALYFKAPKLSKEFVVQVPIGTLVYEIPFSNPPK